MLGEKRGLKRKKSQIREGKSEIPFNSLSRALVSESDTLSVVKPPVPFASRV